MNILHLAAPSTQHACRTRSLLLSTPPPPDQDISASPRSSPPRVTAWRSHLAPSICVRRPALRTRTHDMRNMCLGSGRNDQLFTDVGTVIHVNCTYGAPVEACTARRLPYSADYRTRSQALIGRPAHRKSDEEKRAEERRPVSLCQVEASRLSLSGSWSCTVHCALSSEVVMVCE